MEKIPCIVRRDLTPEQVRAYRVVDNKIAELSEWNEELLAQEIAALPEFNFADYGFDLGALATDMADADTTEDDFDVDAEPEEIRVHRGEIWKLGEHRLMCGDSTSAADIDRLMGGATADLWLTDPPYNVNYGADPVEGEERTIMNDNMGDDEFRKFLTKAFTLAAAKMKPGAAGYICHADSEGWNFRSACREAGFTLRQCLVWRKDSLVLGRQDYQWIHEPILYFWKDGAAHKWNSDRKQTTCLEFDRPKKSDLHPCLTPETMVMTDRGYIPIGEVRKGSMVLSADGRFHKVEFVSRHHYSEKIYEIRAAGSNLVDRATHNHPYLVVRKQASGKADVRWVDAEDVKVGDYLMTPQVEFGSEEPMDELDAWCYGLWLAQGSVLRSGNSRTAKYPQFALNAKKPMLRDRLVDWGKGVKVSTYKNGSGCGISVVVFDARKGEKCVELCGTHAASKCVSPEVFTWNKKLRKAFFEGYMAGDGCVIRTRGHRHSKSVSRALASQIKFMAESLGYKTAMYLRKAPQGTGIGERKFKTTRPYWSSDYKLTNERMWQTRPFEHKGVKYWLRKVVSATAHEYDSEVVNLSVEGCHTFQTACGMTHNTMKPIALMAYLMSNSSDKGDAVLETFGGSGTTLIAAERLGRRCFCMELDEKYATVILNRWEEETGKVGERVEAAANGEEQK